MTFERLFQNICNLKFEINLNSASPFVFFPSNLFFISTYQPYTRHRLLRPRHKPFSSQRSFAFSFVVIMSSKVVRKMLWTSNLDTQQEVSTKNDTQKLSYEAPSLKKETNDSNTADMSDLMNLQVKFMLGLDSGSAASSKRPVNSKKTKPRMETIVTNSRGSAAVAKKSSVPTFNKHTHMRELKKAKLAKLARQFQQFEKEMKKKKKASKSKKELKKT